MKRLFGYYPVNKNIQIFGLAFLLFILSAFVVFYRLGTPQAIVFDETYHIPSAQKYLNGVFFQENHPPLGKLLIAWGYFILYNDNIKGDFLVVDKISEPWPNYINISGYRISSAIFGVFLPVLFFLVVYLVTERTSISFFASLLLLTDTATLMQSRIAMLDVFLIFFIILSLLIFLLLWKKYKLSILIIWGITASCAFSVKYTGLITIVPMIFMVIIWVTQKNWRKSIVSVTIFGVSFLATFFLIWQIHFVLTQKIVETKTYNASTRHIQAISDANINLVTRFSIRLIDSLQYHVMYNRGVPNLKLGNPDEIGSPWYYWVLGGKAINYRWETNDGVVYKYSYLITNPITWMISLLGVILSTSMVISLAFFNFLPNSRLRSSMIIFVGIYWAYVIPFWFIQRVMYLYHYLPGMMVGLILFSIVTRLHSISNKKYFLFILSLVGLMALIVFILLSPFVYYQGLTEAEFQMRNFWPFWEIQCVSCR